MKKIKIIIVFIGLAALIYACKKDQTIIIKEVRVVLRINPLTDFSELAPKAQFFDINAGNASIVESSRGAKFYFPGNCLRDKAGKLVTGKVNIKLIEYNNKADMIFSNVTAVSQDKILESGGMFFIEAIQNGESLKMDSFVGFKIMVPPTNGAPKNMQFWQGEKNKKDSFNVIDWKKQDSVVVENIEDTSTRTVNYVITFDYFKFGFCNIDHVLFTGALVSNFVINMPEGCTDTNSTSLLMFKKYNACAWCNWKNKTQMSTYYRLGVAENIRVLVYKKTGKNANELAYAIAEINTTSNTEVNLPNLKSCTKTELDNIIKDL